MSKFKVLTSVTTTWLPNQPKASIWNNRMANFSWISEIFPDFPPGSPIRFESKGPLKRLTKAPRLSLSHRDDKRSVLYLEVEDLSTIISFGFYRSTIFKFILWIRSQTINAHRRTHIHNVVVYLNTRTGEPVLMNRQVHRANCPMNVHLCDSNWDILDRDQVFFVFSILWNYSWWCMTGMTAARTIRRVTAKNLAA